MNPYSGSSTRRGPTPARLAVVPHARGVPQSGYSTPGASGHRRGGRSREEDAASSTRRSATSTSAQQGDLRLSASARRELRALGIGCGGRRRVARLMREAGLRGCLRGVRGGGAPPGETRARARARRSGPRSRHRRELAAAAPDRLWMADVTYVRTDEGFSSTWPSSSTPAPASWSAGRCGLPPPHRTGSRRPGDGRLETETGRRVVIHRTPIADRSTRPCVVRQAARRGRHRAVDGPHRPRPGRRHGRRELRLSTLKAELVGRSPPLPYPRSGQGGDIFEYVEGFYNRVRRHSSPGYLSPSDYETATMEVKVA